MQRNSFAWEVKGIDETGHIEGLAAGYDNVDFGNDRILKGAFAKSLAGRSGVPMLLFHDQQRPVGKWHTFEESSDGLVVKGKISVKTRDGGEAYELVKDGALAALSIGYDATVKRMSGKVRELVEVFLHEVSLVSIGMNPKAQVDGVKGRIAKVTNVRDLEDMLREAAGLSKTQATLHASAIWKTLSGRRDSGEDEGQVVQGLTEFFRSKAA